MGVVEEEGGWVGSGRGEDLDCKRDERGGGGEEVGG